VIRLLTSRYLPRDGRAICPAPTQPEMEQLALATAAQVETVRDCWLIATGVLPTRPGRQQASTAGNFLNRS